MQGLTGQSVGDGVCRSWSVVGRVLLFWGLGEESLLSGMDSVVVVRRVSMVSVIRSCEVQVLLMWEKVVADVEMVKSGKVDMVRNFVEFDGASHFLACTLQVSWWDLDETAAEYLRGKLCVSFLEPSAKR